MRATPLGQYALTSWFVLAVVISISSPAAGQAVHRASDDPCPGLVKEVSGRSPRAAFAAVRENRCQDALPVLQEMYKSGRGAYRDEILMLLSGLWSPDAGIHPEQASRFPKVKGIYLDILKEAFQTPTTAPTAARLAEQWDVGKELKGDLVALLRRAAAEGGHRFAGAFLPALRLLMSAKPGAVPGKKLEDAYIALLNSSPETQGFEVNILAARALGELRSRKPEAIKGLVKGLFLTSADGKSGFDASRDALLNIGKPVVPYLVDVLDAGPRGAGEEYLRLFAARRGAPDWIWRTGRQIPMVLAQLRDKRAARTIIKDMSRPVIEPVALPHWQRRDWTIHQVTRITFDGWALMSIFNKDVMSDALRAIRDRKEEGSARLQLAYALAFNFTPEAVDTLFRVVHEAGERERGLPPPATDSDFVTRFLMAVAYAVGHSNLARFRNVFVDGFDKYFGDVERADDILEMLSMLHVQILLRVPAVCRKNLDCYLEVFRGNRWDGPSHEEVFDPSNFRGVEERETMYILACGRTKAALVLGRWKASKKQRARILAALAEVYADLPYDAEIYDDLRRGILLGLERQGRKAPGKAIAVLKNLMSGEADKGADAVEWNHRLRALQIFLEHESRDK